MVCLSRPHHFKFFKGCLPQISLGPFLNTLSHIGIILCLLLSSFDICQKIIEVKQTSLSNDLPVFPIYHISDFNSFQLGINPVDFSLRYIQGNPIWPHDIIFDELHPRVRWTIHWYFLNGGCGSPVGPINKPLWNILMLLNSIHMHMYQIVDNNILFS